MNEDTSQHEIDHGGRDTSLWRRFFATKPDGALTVLRLAAGTMIWPHGAQKLLGLFGGHGPEGTIGFMTSMGIPPALAWLAIVAEFFGGIGLALGLLTRLSAFGVFATLATALASVHLKNGFFMNWGGQQAGEGIEFFLLVLPVLALLVVGGGGLWSVDGWLARKSLRGLPRVSARALGS